MQVFSKVHALPLCVIKVYALLESIHHFFIIIFLEKRGSKVKYFNTRIRKIFNLQYMIFQLFSLERTRPGKLLKCETKLSRTFI